MTEKAQKIEAPYIHKKLPPPTKKYVFENRKRPGQALKFFAGNAPKKGVENINETCPNYCLQHGKICELPEDVADNLKSRGINRPVMAEDESGFQRHEGEYFLDRRFDLHEVN